MRPVATIAVLNFQRQRTLRQVLQRAVSQRCAGIEVLVVDNGSTDGSGAMVRTEFPAVRLLELPRNVGCAARNEGVAAARGDVVITIDNDVLLTTDYDVRTAVQLFRDHPLAGCINFRIDDAQGSLSRRDWCHPRDWRTFHDQEFLTDYVLEGACAFRRAAFERVGGYWPPFFLGHEGLDLGLRLLEEGYELLYSPRVRVTHLVSEEARPSSRIYYTFTRNSIWATLRNHRPVPAAWALGKDVGLMAFASARAGQWRSFLRGVRDGVAGAPSALTSRRPLHRNTYRRLRSIRALQPSLLAKVQRHWKERLI
jgi:GT2 family glycosyltransferase